MATLFGGDVDELLSLARTEQVNAARNQIKAKQEQALRLYRKNRGDT
jgi:hypothetical protein